MNNMTKTNHPVIIGVGQVTHRKKIEGDSLSALDLALQAIKVCIEDAGRDDLLKYVDSFSVVNIYEESLNHPEERLCRMLNISPALREQSAISGTSPQLLIGKAADRIVAGEIKMALLVGAEALYREKKSKKRLDDYSWEDLLAQHQKDPSIIGDSRLSLTPHERLYIVNFLATQIYPLFENALRGDLGMNIIEHRRFLAGYFKAMALAAKDNPLAWSNKGSKIDGDVTIPTEKNPIFNFPYTKYMNPNPAVNQAAALIITDTATARKLSIPQDKWVFPHAGVESHDKWFLSERLNYFSSPAIRLNVQESLDYAGLDMSDIDFFDFYSCFPCAALIAAREVGLNLRDLPPLSITGGLSYFGGPGSNYVMHSIAHAVERLRKHPKEYGLITGVGQFLTKHSAGIYSGQEPKHPWNRQRIKPIQPRVDAMISPALCEKPHGRMAIETYTVLHDITPLGPVALVIGRLDSGHRCWASSDRNFDLAWRMEQEDFLGQEVSVIPGDNSPNIFNLK